MGRKTLITLANKW